MNSRNKKFKKELIVKSSTDNLSLIRDFTKDAASQSGFDDEVVGKIVLAVDEACSNIIKHAYNYSPEGEIIITVNSDKAKLTISIIDEGVHFDPEIVPDPDIQEYHKQKRVGGLGMFLMKKLMDDVKYINISGNRNQVVLVKYLS